MTVTDLLHAQLDDAIADGYPLEIAMLAGSLARYGCAVAPSVQDLCATVDLVELQDAIEGAVDGYLRTEEDDDPAESWDVLSALDEVCAAATWLGFGPLLGDAVGLAVRTTRAFPECWVCHAEAARAVLATCAPLRGDPSLPLWQAIARAPLAVHEITAESR